MKKNWYLHLSIFFVLTSILCCSPLLFAEEEAHSGPITKESCSVNQNDNCKLKLRLELGSSFRVGQKEDDVDGTMVSSTLDIGKELSPRTTLSLRILPVFGYFQEGNVEDVAGFGVGGALRIYLKKNQEKGFFTEIHEVVCLHENKFEGNDSNLNFYSAIGIGYQFCPHWDILLRFGHISNAEIKDRNEGTNLLGLGIGYTF